MPENVSLTQVIRAGTQALQAGLHTSMPGVIKSYNPVTKTADVLPVLKVPTFDPETGDPDEAEEMPVIPNVPVSFPRGGGWHLSFPLSVGDHVTLVFSEAATGQWRTTGEVSEPADVRRHALGYPTAFLGAHPDLDVLLDDVPTNLITLGKLVLGKDGDPTKSLRIGSAGIELGGLLPVPLALAPGTVTALTALATYVTALTAAAASATDFLTFKAAVAGPGATASAAVAAAAVTISATIGKSQ